MPNLLIVDDEETTRNSLSELVPWSEWGIAEVRTAENGVTALKLAQHYRPAILLADIRMPKMNGIELAQRIRDLYPACEIVFLSGFADKAYLKSAIQLQAVDYLDKPVEMEQLKQVFLGIVKRLASAVGTKGDIAFLRQEIVVDLICKKGDLTDWIARASPDMLQLRGGGRYRVYALTLHWASAAAEEERTVWKHSMLNRFNQADAFPGTRMIAGFVGDNCLVVAAEATIQRGGEEKGAAEGEAEGEELAWLMLTALLDVCPAGACSISAGCSDMTPRTDAFAGLYKTALTAAKRHFYHGDSRVYMPIAATAGYSFDFDKSGYAGFKRMLREAAAQDVIDYVRRLSADIARSADPDTNKIRNLFFNHLRILFETTMQWDEANAGDENEATYMWREIDTRATLEELTRFLLAHVEMTLQKPAANGVDKIDEIKRYIDHHYASNQISIQSIADHTHLSQTYLCALFKKATGRTVNDYITALRIEKAKALLLDRGKKLYEITADVGLIDTNYFSTLFKKYTGMTPSDYRTKSFHEA